MLPIDRQSQAATLHGLKLTGCHDEHAAQFMGVSPATIKRLKKTPEYTETVQSYIAAQQDINVRLNSLQITLITEIESQLEHLRKEGLSVNDRIRLLSAVARFISITVET